MLTDLLRMRARGVVQSCGRAPRSLVPRPNPQKAFCNLGVGSGHETSCAWHMDPCMVYIWSIRLDSVYVYKSRSPDQDMQESTWLCARDYYGIPKQTKLDDTQNNCQTDLHIKQLSNLSRTIVKLVQNNCQTATHKILCTLCLKHLSVLVQNYCQRHAFAMVKTTQVCHAQMYKIVMLNPRTN